jgi:hypothetical protein
MSAERYGGNTVYTSAYMTTYVGDRPLPTSNSAAMAINYETDIRFSFLKFRMDVSEHS